MYINVVTQYIKVYPVYSCVTDCHFQKDICKNKNKMYSTFTTKNLKTYMTKHTLCCSTPPVHSTLYYINTCILYVILCTWVLNFHGLDSYIVSTSLPWKIITDSTVCYLVYYCYNKSCMSYPKKIH